MSRILALAALAALAACFPSSHGNATVRHGPPGPEFQTQPLRPVCHTKPHEPPARILNQKKRRKA